MGPDRRLIDRLRAAVWMIKVASDSDQGNATSSSHTRINSTTRGLVQNLRRMRRRYRR